ncbi:unnamed protein product [Ascophyllum nodosum]
MWHLKRNKSRAMRSCAPATKMEASRAKNKVALINHGLEGIDSDVGNKAHIQTVVEPMHTSQKNKSINMTSDPAESDDECGGSGGYHRGDGSLSIARLGAPLPLLVSHPGRQPHLPTQEFSVSFPSGIRRTSSLTTSITPCLGPPPPTVPATTKTTNFGETDQSDGRGGHREIENSRAMRCPECAMFIQRNQIVRHIRSTCRLVPCTLCERLLLPAAQELHVEEACHNRCLRCEQCGEEVIASKYARHGLRGGCVSKAVPCSACEEICFADELQEHKEKICPERDVRCSSCGMELPARQLPDHAALLCPKLTWTCPCSQDSLPLVERCNHLKKCNAFIDAWEASIKQVIARMPKREVLRSIGRVMMSTRIEDPCLALLAFAESTGNALLATRNIMHGRHYLDELLLANDVVNVKVFLESLQKPGKSGAGSF